MLQLLIKIFWVPIYIYAIFLCMIWNYIWKIYTYSSCQKIPTQLVGFDEINSTKLQLFMGNLDRWWEKSSLDRGRERERESVIANILLSCYPQTINKTTVFTHQAVNWDIAEVWKHRKLHVSKPLVIMKENTWMSPNHSYTTCWI